MLNLIGDLQELNIKYNFKDNYDLESYQEELYLAGISFDENKDQNYLKIFIYDNFQEIWDEIYTQEIQFSLKINDYQIKFIKLNNLYCKENLFIVIKISDINLTLRLEDDNFFVEVTNSIDLYKFLDQLYINNENGIYLLEQNLVDNQFSANFKYWSDWSQETPEIIKISDNLLEEKQTISKFSFYKNSLYLGRNNQQKGIDIYKLSFQNKNEINNANWQPIIVKGAYRYSLNQKIFALIVFQDYLYLACGLDLENQKSPQFNNYKNGFELIRIYEDNDWDIIVGSPKFSPQGLKVPLSTLDSGFSDNNNIIVNNLIIHNDKLYLWTKNIDNLQLWFTDNGEDWEQKISDIPINNYAEINIIKTLSSSLGLITIIDFYNLDKTKNVKIFNCF